jgi:hypothetical protein
MHFLGIEDTFWGYKSIFSGKDSTFLGKEVTFLGINLKKSAFWWLGVFLFYVLRFFLTMGIVRAQYSKCHPRHFFISRSSVGRIREGIRELKETAILTKRTFANTHIGRAYPPQKKKNGTTGITTTKKHLPE